ncbi:MAG: HNH endonuclease [Actinomycetota bacterium]|nr:HNH endonuclease [Actinomycetota bacterium]
MAPGWTREDDAALRVAAQQWLSVRTNDGLDPIHSEDLADFTFRGQRIALIDPQRGIRKPAVLDAALSIRTVYRPEGAARPYQDGTGPDGLIRYKWRGEDGNYSENRALRAAMELRLPLIWFFGVGSALYQPVFPVYLVGEEPDLQQFALALDETFEIRDVDTPAEAQLRRYIIRETKQRLHQPVFRSTVLRAYERRCAVCSLAHPQLLDAAHIVPDSDERGEASVVNGLAMCKLHHSAYDSRLLGITPDYVVEVTPRIMAEVDGPTLLHGLQGRHGQRLMVLPRARREHPSPDLLGIRYEAFRDTGS